MIYGILFIAGILVLMYLAYKFFIAIPEDKAMKKRKDNDNDLRQWTK